MNRNGPFQDRVGSIWDQSCVNIALKVAINFLSCLETHYESEALYIVF